MNFNEFWVELEKGGTTPEGDEFSVIVTDAKPHILSPGNKNRKFNIKPATVERYFTTDIPKFGVRFGYKRSAYFLNVYRHIVGENEYNAVMEAAQERNRR